MSTESTITRTFTTASGQTVEQAVNVERVTVCGRAWLHFHTEVCPVGEYTGDALAHGASLAVGGICVSGGRYFLQHALPVSATRADVDLVVDMLAHEAARLRAHALAPVPTNAATFAYFAE